MIDDNVLDLSRRTVLGGLAGLFGAGAVAGTTGVGVAQQESQQQPGINYDVRARQREGGPVNWVLPGPRRLSEEVFGTPDNPLLGNDYLEHAKQMNPGMASVLDQFPTLVGLPEGMRQTNDAGDAYTVTSEPTAFSDAHRPVDGHIDVTYMDRSPWAGFRQGRDQVQLDVQFTDPDDNSYSVQVAQLDRETKEHAGGVLTGGLIHGSTGIGSPLFPKVYNYGAFWGVGTLDVNDGSQTMQNRVIHFMTTQMARDNNYALAVDEEMPLGDPLHGRPHHTHGFVFPIEMTQDGPQFSPLDLPYQGQPFIHIMYDLDEVSIQASGIADQPQDDDEPRGEDGDDDGGGGNGGGGGGDGGG